MDLKHVRSPLGVVAVLLLLAVPATPAEAQTCTPATTPCQTCPAPPPCPAPTDPTCGGFKSCGPFGCGGNTTFTTSTITCPGAFAQTTLTTTQAVGPGNICVGPNKSIGCAIAAGTSNINTNTDTILFSAAVGVPTLSVWGFGVLVVTLGALALRRLRSRPI